MVSKTTKVSKAKTLTGLPENTEAALTYLLGWVTGLIFLVLEKKNKKIRFHAMQSLATFFLVQILMFVSFFLAPLVMIIAFVLWLVLMIKAYQGEKFKLPIIGDFAEKQIGK